MDKGKLRNNTKGKSAYIIRSPLRDAVRSDNDFINALIIVVEFGNDGVLHKCERLLHIFSVDLVKNDMAPLLSQ